MPEQLVDNQNALACELSDLKDRYQDLLSKCKRSEQRAKEAAETELLAKAIIAHSPAVLFRRLSDEAASLVYVSDNIMQWGYSALDFLTEKIHFRDIVHPADRDRVREEIQSYQLSGRNDYEQEYRIITKDKKVRWVHDRTSVVRGLDGEVAYNQGLLLDVTQRKQAEQELASSEKKLRRILETAGEGFVLMDLNLRISEVNQAYCDMLGYTREEILGKNPLDLATPASRKYMAANHDSILSQDYRTIEVELQAKDGHAVPVLIHGNTLRCEDGAVLGNVAFVSDMTAHKRALALAGEVQKSLLPQEAPQINGFDIAGKSVSCEDVGGDYFDFLQGSCENKQNLCVAVGDISGHGVDAALLMTTARAFLRARAQEPGSLADIIGDFNRHLADDLFGSGRFMTFFAMTLEPERGRISWVRAGHDPALLYHPDQDRFEELGGEGLPIAVERETRYEERYLEGVEPGQIIAIGTDGIWEAVNQSGEMFGKERYMELIRQHSGKSALEILDAVFSEVEQFALGTKQGDDITLVVIKAVA